MNHLLKNLLLIEDALQLGPINPNELITLIHVCIYVFWGSFGYFVIKKLVEGVENDRINTNSSTT